MIIEDIVDKKELIIIFNDHIADSRTKGIDKMSPIQMKTDLTTVIDTINIKCIKGEYNFSPYLEKLISRGRNKIPRVISIPTARDRILLKALCLYLQKQFPTCINHDLPNACISKVFDYLKLHTQTSYIKADISSFYDNIDHKQLISKLKFKIRDKIILDLIVKAIKTPTLNNKMTKEDKKRTHSVKGIPQGLAISNILAEIYLEDFDEKIGKKYPFYLRYVDDVLLFTNNKASLAKKEIARELRLLGLRLNKKKSSYGTLTKPIIFLGYCISRDKITIPEKRVSAYLTRVAGLFTNFRKGWNDIQFRPISTKTDDHKYKEIFIEELNKKITGAKSDKKRYGWVCYYSQITDITLLNRVDMRIRSFFFKLDAFGNKPPSELKKTVRAHYESKYSKTTSYLYDYSLIDTINKKEQYLLFRGKINPSHGLSDVQIESIFQHYTQTELYSLEMDSGIFKGQYL